MKNKKCIYKDTFAVIGKAGEGPADSPKTWVMPLWEEANRSFSEIADIICKTETGAPLGVWGAMNDANESNKRWDITGKYMAGCEADQKAQAPKGWTKWRIPSQTYLVVSCSGKEYEETLDQITGDARFPIKGTIHERYPQPGNPNVLELYVPVLEGMAHCQSCSLPMTIPEDFGTETDGSPNFHYCHHCYENGQLRQRTFKIGRRRSLHIDEKRQL